MFRRCGQTLSGLSPVGVLFGVPEQPGNWIGPRMNLRNLVIWGVIIVVLIGLYSMMTQGARSANGARDISYSQLLDKVERGEIRKATIQGSTVSVADAGGRAFTTATPENQDDLVKRLEAQNADISVKPAGGFTVIGFLLQSL